MTIHEYKNAPCPICSRIGWCGRREDGLELCKRPPSPPEVAGYTFMGMAKDGQTGMYVEIGKERPSRGPSPAGGGTTPGQSRPPSEKRHVSLAEVFAASVKALTPDRRAVLASDLGLPESAPGGMPIGWDDDAHHHANHNIRGAYVLPEYDGQGRLVGVTYRFPAAAVADKTDAKGEPLGTKSGPAGGKRGLTLPLCVKDMPDPVLSAEGASDVLAGLAVGMSLIGRPSNSGGVEFIAQVFRHRQVIILGENDRKPDGRWPGKEGAEAVVRRLEAIWGRPVHVAYPPEGIKDLRDWVRHLVPDWQTVDAGAVRQTILAAVQPPPLLLLVNPPDNRGRAVIKVFRWADGVDGVAIHSDRLHVEDAAARKRFAKAVAKVEPGTDVDELTGRLLALKIQPGGFSKSQSGSSTPLAVAARPASGPATSDDHAGQGTDAERLPTVLLPGGPVSITQSAEILGRLLDKTNSYYLRGGAVVTIARDDDGHPFLELIKPAGLASVFETVANLRKFARVRDQYVEQEAISTEQDAKLIQHCAAFGSLLPPIRLLSRCPVLIERDGQLVEVCGYDRESGIMAFGEPAADVPLDQADRLLEEMLSDFQFATPGDRSRALAAIITPALIFGRLLGGRSPVDLGEADDSQSGKGYRNKITAAVYGYTVKTVTQKKGGVGSLEETFSTALTRGSNFISLDNVRGAIDSPLIESFLTEDTFQARTPHQAAVEVDPRRVIVQLTSNKADITIDLANRSSCVRILKQPDGYVFRKYPEGDILEHVRANRSLYLGAVFAIIRDWHKRGKQRSDETRHAFRPWAQTLDWIVQNLLGSCPLLDGHRETQARMTTPNLNWLRDVALAVRDADQLDQWLRANRLIDIISESPRVELPGMFENADLMDEAVRKRTLQALGRRLSHCFGSDSVRVIDGFEIERREQEDSWSRKTAREYCFRVAPTPPGDRAYTPNDHSRTIDAPIGAECLPGIDPASVHAVPQPATSQATARCAYTAPIDATKTASIESPCAPNATIDSLTDCMGDQKRRVSTNACAIVDAVNIDIGSHRRIGAIDTPSATPEAPGKPNDSCQPRTADAVLRFCRCPDCRRRRTCPLASADESRWHYCANYNGVQTDPDVLAVPYPPHAPGVAPVGPCSNGAAEVEPVANPPAWTKRGQTGGVVGQSGEAGPGPARFYGSSPRDQAGDGQAIGHGRSIYFRQNATTIYGSVNNANN